MTNTFQKFSFQIVGRGVIVSWGTKIRYIYHLDDAGERILKKQKQKQKGVSTYIICSMTPADIFATNSDLGPETFDECLSVAQFGSPKRFDIV